MTTQQTSRTVTAPGYSAVSKAAVRAYHSVARACGAAALPCAIAIALIVTVSLPGASGVDPLGLVATGLAQTKPPAPTKPPAQAKPPAQTKPPAPTQQPAPPPQALNPAGGQPAGPPVTPKPGGPLTPSRTTYKVDAIEFFLTPNQFVEYKFNLTTGATMMFNWKATGPLDVDFHTVPEGKPISASETYFRGKASSGSGTYRAPYPGLHGWYWLNSGKEGVKIVLNASGFFTQGMMFSGDPVGEPMEVKDPPPPE
jgi:hypothetical protein